MYQALKQKPQRCAVLNKHAAQQNLTKSLLKDIGAIKINLKLDGVGINQGCVEYYHIPRQQHTFPSPKKTANGCLSYYLLDAASILPVLALDVGPSCTVLDMCAAPGGKTFLIGQLLSHDGLLVSNEPVKSRRVKLNKVSL